MIMHVPPACQGQIVEVSYGDACNGKLYKRVYDRSDRTEDWYVADADGCGCDCECNCFEPWNRIPGNFDWIPCDEPKDEDEEE